MKMPSNAGRDKVTHKQHIFLLSRGTAKIQYIKQRNHRNEDIFFKEKLRLNKGYLIINGKQIKLKLTTAMAHINKNARRETCDY